MSSNSPGLYDYVILTSLAAIFGASFLLTSVSVAELPPLTVVASRLLLAFCLLYPIMRFAGQRLPKFGRIWIYIVASAFFGNALPFSLISWGQVHVEAGLTAIFMATMPLATIVLAQIFTEDEKLNRWKIVGVLCGLIGVMILIGPDILVTLGESTIRQLAVIAGALCYAINAIVSKKLLNLPKLSMITALMFVASFLLVPLSLFVDRPWELDPSPASLAAILALSIGPTAFATLLILVIVDRRGASFLSQINFMVPVFGMLFGMIFLSERPGVDATFALAVILFGVALTRHGSR